jgi:hypothetical protein
LEEGLFKAEEVNEVDAERNRATPAPHEDIWDDDERVDWDDEEEGLFNAMAVNKEGDQSKSSD